MIKGYFFGHHFLNNIFENDMYLIGRKIFGGKFDPNIATRNKIF